jgi:hypothetical protein
MPRKGGRAVSDSTLRAWPAFAARVQARLEADACAYPESPSRSELELLDEIAQELEDVAGWSCVLWSKLEAIKARLGNAPSGQPQGPEWNGDVFERLVSEWFVHSDNSWSAPSTN